MYCANMKEFYILNFHRCFIHILSHILAIALSCVLGLKEMSINVTENVLVENYQYLYQ